MKNNNLPNCKICGNNRQVWKNQITGKLTCHRLGCHKEIVNDNNRRSNQNTTR